MADLGKLTITLEAKGGDAVLNQLQRIEAALRRTSASTSTVVTQTNQLSAAGARLNRDFFGSLNSGSVNIHNVNKSFLDLAQTMAIFSRVDPFAKFRQNFQNLKTSVFAFRDFIKEYKQFQTAIAKARPDQGAQIRENWERSKGAQIGRIFGNLQNLFDTPGGKKLAANRFLEANEFINVSMKTGGINTIASMFNRKNFSKAIGFLGNYLWDATKEAFKFQTAVYAAVIPALIAISKYASEASSNLQAMTARMTAVKYGQLIGGNGGPVSLAQAISSPMDQKALTAANKQAQEMLKFIKALAIPTSFTANELFESASQMESFGLNAKRSLATATLLAEAFGGTNEELQMITRMMGRMAAGELPDARAFGRFGMNKELLFAATARNLGKDIKNLTGEEMLGAFEKFVVQRYSKVLDLIGNTERSKRASLIESFTFGMAEIGKPINAELIKIYDNLITFINQFVQSDAAAELGNTIANLMKVFSEPDVAYVLKQIFYDIVGILDAATYSLMAFTRGLAGAYLLAREALKVWAGFKTFGLSNLSEGNVFSPKDFGTGLKLLFQQPMVQPAGVQVSNYFEGSGKFRRLMEIVEGKGNKPFEWMKDTALNDKFIADQGKVQSELEESNDKLKSIDGNTKSLVDELTLRRANLGGRGGPLANLGMSYPDLVVSSMLSNSNAPSNGDSLRTTSLMNPMSLLEMGIRRAATPSFAFDRRRW